MIDNPSGAARWILLALASGLATACTVEDAEDKPWGDRVATVTDPDGYKWVLATFKKLAPFT